MREPPNICGHFFCAQKCTFASKNKTLRVNKHKTLELRYLRWDYLSRSPNPPEEWINSIKKIVKYLSSTFYPKYKIVFEGQGMDQDDFENLIWTYAVSFYGNSSYHTKPEQMKAETKKLNKEQLKKKDNYRLMAFVKQRLIDARYVLISRFKEDVCSKESALYKISAEKYEHVKYLYPDDPTQFGWEKANPEEYFAFSSALSERSILKINGFVYKVFKPHLELISKDDLSHDDDFVNDAYNIPHYGDSPLDAAIKMEEQEPNNPSYMDFIGDQAPKAFLKKVIKNPEKYGLNKNKVCDILEKHGYSQGIN